MSDVVSLPEKITIGVYSSPNTNPKTLFFSVHPDSCCICDSCKSTRNTIAVLYFQGLIALSEESRVYAQRGAFEHFDM